MVTTASRGVDANDIDADLDGFNRFGVGLT